jgi:hypothetical protein
MPRSIQDLDQAIAQVASDLEDIREKRSVLRLQYGSKEDVLRAQKNKLDQRWIKRRNVAKPHEYAEFMEKMHNKTKLFPGIVVRQQADLCRALHQMEALEQELAGVKDLQVETLRVMYQQMKQLSEEKDRIELEYMNKLCTVEQELDEIRERRNNFISKIGLEERESMSTASTADEESEEDEPVEPQRPPVLTGLRSMFSRTPSTKTLGNPRDMFGRTASTKTLGNPRDMFARTASTKTLGNPRDMFGRTASTKTLGNPRDMFARTASTKTLGNPREPELMLRRRHPTNQLFVPPPQLEVRHIGLVDRQRMIDLLT